MKSFLKRYWHWLTVTLVFVVLVVFFSKQPLVDYVRTKASVRRLKAEREVYEKQIRSDSIFLENLKDDAFLEKYAREKFYMHAENEEVYLFE
ncbi:MAG: septum formation initiator family protein [Tidjanibacter sp.]|nr:septum formation initiator family protein [Tidjanibacter sp.]